MAGNDFSAVISHHEGTFWAEHSQTWLKLSSVKNIIKQKCKEEKVMTYCVPYGRYE